METNCFRSNNWQLNWLSCRKHVQVINNLCQPLALILKTLKFCFHIEPNKLLSLIHSFLIHDVSLHCFIHVLYHYNFRFLLQKVMCFFGCSYFSCLRSSSLPSETYLSLQLHVWASQSGFTFSAEGVKTWPKKIWNYEHDFH